MPLYTYEVIHDDGSAGETFQVERRVSDPPLETHPVTGQPVRRVFKPVHIAGFGSDLHTKTLLSDQNLEQHGFTAYRRSGKGHYERTAGNDGPEHLSAGD
jgi:predicted nucleic acid-binding Zn ribbon protein